MEAVINVEKEIEKVISKFNYIDKHTANSLQELLTYVETIKKDLEQGLPEQNIFSPGHELTLNQCLKKVKDTVFKLSTQHKELHASVSKVGKSIDKNFIFDFNAVFVEGVFNNEENTRHINRVICEHFLRQGMIDIAENLVQESHLEIEEYEKEPFLQLHYIMDSLKNHDLNLALQWVDANREKLKARNSSLEFKLHRLYFIELLSKGGDEKQWEAVKYSKNFAPFANSFKKEIQVLMGSLLYMKQGVLSSPYSHIFDAHAWEEIIETFMQESCALLGLSFESPLSTVIKAGSIALPPLLTLKQVMQQRQCSGVWSAKDELPVEIDLGKECHFHSMFACPILRQQSTESNPPVRLVCGHVISRDALTKLSSTANKWALLPNPVTSHKVKCPYCPMEQSPADARQIYF